MRQRHLLSWRGILLISLALIGVAPLATGTGPHYLINWYSDPGYTQLVGERARYCDGSTEQWGTQSGYETWEDLDCGGPGGCTYLIIDGVNYGCI